MNGMNLSSILYIIIGIISCIPLMAYCRKNKWAGSEFDWFVYIILIIFWPIWVTIALLKFSYHLIDAAAKYVERLM